jgi:hypothetical protein
MELGDFDAASENTQDGHQGEKHPSENLQAPVSTSRWLGDSQDITIFNGSWGNWKSWAGTEDGGYYACGAEMRFEDSQGDGDDTAANGLKLVYCHLEAWYDQQTKTIFEGLWGEWKEVALCPFDHYVDGAEVRFEDKVGDGGDDTALNGLKIHCRDKKNKFVQEWITVFGGISGDWKEAVTRDDKYVTHASIRFEDSQDSGDDTAWNGLKFRFETPNSGISKARAKGTWEFRSSGAIISLEVTESMTTTTGEELTKGQSSSVAIELSAGFEFEFPGAKATGGVKVTGTDSSSVAASVSSAITQTKTVTVTVSCGDEPPPTGNWFLWVWIMNQEADASGVGFDMKTTHFRCLSAGERPQCPLNFCGDKRCQTCIPLTA